MISLILAALGAVVLGAIIVVVLLNWGRIKEWFVNFFTNRGKIKNKNEVAFTLKEKLNSGKYKVVQGIFDKHTNEVVDGAQYEAQSLDSTLANYHRHDDLVCYE